MGYNLAIEYLADYEKTWMLDSFRELNDTVLVPQGRPLSQWTFLEVGSCDSCLAVAWWLSEQCFSKLPIIGPL